jgi:hypothetical protein
MSNIDSRRCAGGAGNAGGSGGAGGLNVGRIGIGSFGAMLRKRGIS